MEKYISQLRQAGYPGPIQVIRMSVSDHTWLYDASLSLEDDLKKHGYNGHVLSRVVTYPDTEHNLDVTGLEFSPSHRGQPEIVNLHPPMESRGNTEAYYQVTRRYIGNEMLFTPGISAMVIDQQGRIAIAKRADDKRWAIPGGSKELGEDIYHNLRGEIREEIALEVANPRILALLSGPGCIMHYPNGHLLHYMSFVFAADHAGGELRVNDHENTAVHWASRKELEDTLPEKYHIRLNMLDDFDGTVTFLNT